MGATAPEETVPMPKDNEKADILTIEFLEIGKPLDIKLNGIGAKDHSYDGIHIVEEQALSDFGNKTDQPGQPSWNNGTGTH